MKLDDLKKRLEVQARAEGFAAMGICAPDAVPEAAGRLAEALVLPLRRLPPETLVPGLSGSHEAKCFSLGQALMSVPVSDSTVRTVLSLIPLIPVRSTPVRRWRSGRASNDRSFS